MRDCTIHVSTSTSTAPLQPTMNNISTGQLEKARSHTVNRAHVNRCTRGEIRQHLLFLLETELINSKFLILILILSKKFLALCGKNMQRTIKHNGSNLYFIFPRIIIQKIIPYIYIIFLKMFPDFIMESRRNETLSKLRGSQRTNEWPRGGIKRLSIWAKTAPPRPVSRGALRDQSVQSRPT